MKRNMHFIRFVLLVSVIGFSVYAYSRAERSVTFAKGRNKKVMFYQKRMTSQDTTFMKRAISIGRDVGKSRYDKPAGSIIVINDKVVGEGWDKVLSNGDPTAHAEIEAVRAATKNLNMLSLEGSVLYSTRPPCMMCLGVLDEVGVDVIYYSYPAEQAISNRIGDTHEKRCHRSGAGSTIQIPLRIQLDR